MSYVFSTKGDVPKVKLTMYMHIAMSTIYYVVYEFLKASIDTKDDLKKNTRKTCYLMPTQQLPSGTMCYL